MRMKLTERQTGRYLLGRGAWSLALSWAGCLPFPRANTTAPALNPLRPSVTPMLALLGRRPETQRCRCPPPPSWRSDRRAVGERRRAARVEGLKLRERIHNNKAARQASRVVWVIIVVTGCSFPSVQHQSNDLSSSPSMYVFIQRRVYARPEGNRSHLHFHIDYFQPLIRPPHHVFAE